MTQFGCLSFPILCADVGRPDAQFRRSHDATADGHAETRGEGLPPGHVVRPQRQHQPGLPVGGYAAAQTFPTHAQYHHPAAGWVACGFRNL